MLLENFLESIESLPVDTKRNLTLIGELDKRATEAVDDAKHKVDEYLKRVHVMRPSERNAHIEEMNKRFQEAIDLTEQKQAVALQTYQLIDKHIRRLDANLSALAQELDDDQASACSSEKRTKNQPATSSKQSRGTTSRSTNSRKRPLNESGRSQSRRGRKPKRKRVEDEAADERAAAKDRESDADGALSEDEAVSRSIPAAAKLALSVGQKPEELLLAVDPNEPVYCICKRVSYGEMIACDNQDCVTEWYHLDCVNLKVIPRGKWYCPTCRSERDGKF